MSDDDRPRKFAELAPLTKSFALHLASYLLRASQRPAGRPHKMEGEDVVTRAERRLLAALDQLIPLIQARRQTIFDLVNPVLSSGNLTEKWLLQTLSQYTPGQMMIYPQRLAEWRDVHLLLRTASGEPEPNSVCCLLLARMLNPNRTGWLPRPTAAEAYWCWRLDAPGRILLPYEMPLVILDQERPDVVKIAPREEEVPFVLWTPWQGAAWDSDAWVVVEGGAIRWVGEPTMNQLPQWLSQQEMATLAASGAEGNSNQSRQALRILADHLIHNADSNTSRTT